MGPIYQVCRFHLRYGGSSLSYRVLCGSMSSPKDCRIVNGAVNDTAESINRQPHTWPTSRRSPRLQIVGNYRGTVYQERHLRNPKYCSLDSKRWRTTHPIMESKILDSLQRGSCTKKIDYSSLGSTLMHDSLLPSPLFKFCANAPQLQLDHKPSTCQALSHALKICPPGSCGRDTSRSFVFGLPYILPACLT
jgi:hypothetical protein